MKTIYTLACILFLSACGTTTNTDKYLALNKSVTVATKAAEDYVDICVKKPATDPCYAKIPAINKAAKTTLATMDAADKAFMMMDAATADLNTLTGVK